MKPAKIVRRLAYRVLPKPLANKLKIKHFRKHEMHCEMWGGDIYADNLNKAIALFANGVDGKKRQRLEDDIILSYIVYGATPAEYFQLNFQDANAITRATFLTDMTKDKECLATLPFDEFNRALTNKYNFYLKNRNFFKRESILIAQTSDKKEIDSFIKSKGKVFVKPNDGSYGCGAFICEYSDAEHLDQLIDTLLSQGDWIAEELIEQSPEMSVWNKSSVNTIRIPSFYSEGNYRILSPFMRTGRRGAVVDNGGAGGIFAAINPEHGEIISDGHDEAGHTYEIHPDSKVAFKGERIPHWDELTALTAKVHNNMPDHKYIAFDFALTANGWVLIEGNWGQFLSQIATGKGVKDQFLKLMHTK